MLAITRSREAITAVRAWMPIIPRVDAHSRRSLTAARIQFWWLDRKMASISVRITYAAPNNTRSAPNVNPEMAPRAFRPNFTNVAPAAILTMTSTTRREAMRRNRSVPCRYHTAAAATKIATTAEHAVSATPEVAYLETTTSQIAAARAAWPIVT